MEGRKSRLGRLRQTVAKQYWSEHHQQPSPEKPPCPAPCKHLKLDNKLSKADVMQRVLELEEVEEDLRKKRQAVDEEKEKLFQELEVQNNNQPAETSNNRLRRLRQQATAQYAPQKMGAAHRLKKYETPVDMLGGTRDAAQMLGLPGTESGSFSIPRGHVASGLSRNPELLSRISRGHPDLIFAGGDESSFTSIKKFFGKWFIVGSCVGLFLLRRFLHAMWETGRQTDE